MSTLDDAFQDDAPNFGGAAMSSQAAASGFFAHLESGQAQQLHEHLLAVSANSRRHAEKIGLGPAGAVIGLLHDLGKYSTSFQEYLRRMSINQDTEEPDSQKGKIDHSTAGAQTVWRRLKQLGTLEGIVGEFLAVCIASHHSGLIDCINPSGFDNLSRRMNKADVDSHFNEAHAAANESVTAAAAIFLGDPLLCTGIQDTVRRICQLDRSKCIQQFKIGLVVRFLFSCLIDADRTDTADFSNSTAASLRQNGRFAVWPDLARQLDAEVAGFPAVSLVDRLRSQVSEACSSSSGRPTGTYLLTVPTGGGKTLASLRFALHHAAKWGMHRVIYVSPYTSIIDQNAKVTRDILEPNGIEFGSVVLEHHSNLTPVKQTWRSKILSENWDAPVVFTTGVQLLESLFGSGTRAVRRMHQMAKSVLIFDEIQTVPITCVHLLSNAANFLVEHCGSTVVLCTATQPLLHEVNPEKGAIRLSENAQLVEDFKELFSQFQRNEVLDRRQPGGWEYAEAAQLAISETRRTGGCLVVVNTKREALSIFSECKERQAGVNIFHLSTAMCPSHRMRTLYEIKSCLRRGEQAICVSTQLIEAGVDISFGSAIRALAGLDSIAQTAGRCNRHGEATIGRVHIINLKGVLPKSLKEIRAAQEAAERVLDENATLSETRTVDLSNPAIIEQYFRYYFFSRQKEMDYPVEPDKADRDDTLLNMLAENKLAVNARSSPPSVFLRQAFQKAADAFEAINANTRGVVVPYTSEGKSIIGELCSAFELSKQFKLLKRTQQFTVNVFPHVLDELQSAGAVHEVQEGTGILHLGERWYSSDFGLNVEGTEAMGFEYA